MQLNLPLFLFAFFISVRNLSLIKGYQYYPMVAAYVGEGITLKKRVNAKNHAFTLTKKLLQNNKANRTVA